MPDAESRLIHMCPWFLVFITNRMVFDSPPPICSLWVYVCHLVQEIQVHEPETCVCLRLSFLAMMSPALNRLPQWQYNPFKELYHFRQTWLCQHHFTFLSLKITDTIFRWRSVFNKFDSLNFFDKFGLKKFNTWKDPFPDSFHDLRAVCLKVSGNHNLKTN